MRRRFTCWILATGVLVFLGGRLSVHADANYYALVPGSPMIQDWTNTSLITTNDNWGSVPSIIGYRGDDGSTSTADIDPRTVLSDLSSVPDVNANQSIPSLFTTFGVAEFQITNPVVALLSSSGQDFPHIDLRLNTASCIAPNSIRVSYNIRDIDDSIRNTAQQVALHYRVGSSGNYTSVPAGYIADATQGGTATQVTPIVALLPAGALGQPQVHVRVLTSNALGSPDEWVGIDDINVSCIGTTAAGVNIRGRVLDSYGRAISRASVTLMSASGAVEKAFANTFGYYSFADVAVGEAYVVSVSARRYTFSNGSTFIHLEDELNGLDFIADR